MRERLKILVFEYICGGGFAGQELPASLMAEGGMMLQTLVAELKSLPQLDVLVVLDKRCAGLELPTELEIVWIESWQSVFSLLPALIAGCDAVWPIAPETAGILANIAAITQSQLKTLLLSATEMVSLCGDKWATYQHLIDFGLPLVETSLLNDFDVNAKGPWVLKPRDGVGCQGGRIVADAQSLAVLRASLKNPEQMLIQPYYSGRAISLSCLFKQGQAWLLCCNQQQIEIIENHFSLQACTVNHANPRRDYYRQLIAQLALALPELWGYIGIDLIETPDDGPLLLEINPRLTTSYVGIQAATGINVAEQVLVLVTEEPVLRPSRNHAVTINIATT